MTKSPNGPLRVGIGGPVGSGKTALMEALCKAFRDRYDICAITNDIYTKEDALILMRAGALPEERIMGVETGGCPHTAIREDASINLAAITQMRRKYPDLDLILIESGGDNLAATFSPELADLTIYVIDVAQGEKIPRKGGPGITRSDLLVINKIDLAPHVGASLEVMEKDTRRMRGERPFVFTNLQHRQGRGRGGALRRGPGRSCVEEPGQAPRRLQGHAPARPHRLLAHRGPPAAALSQGHPAGGVAGVLAGGLGPVAADGAHGDHAAAGGAAAARPAELELARVRHARRLLAAAQDVRARRRRGRRSRSTPGSARATRRWSRRCMDSGWELNAHSYEQIPMHKLDDQRAIIAKTMSTIEKFSGKRPRGWFGPGLTQTFDTVDYLSEAGIEYIGDYVLDDDPVTLENQARGDGGAALHLRGARHRHDEPAAPPTPRSSTPAPWITSAASMRSRRSGPRSWPSPAIPTCRACRTASRTWSARSPTSSGHEGVVAWTGEEILDWYKASRAQ